MDVARFKDLPLMGILRGIRPVELEPLVKAIIDARLVTIEITMNTKGASGLIRQAIKLSNKSLMVGAGTVLNMDDLKCALDSGATFIVMPMLIRDVLEYCVKNKIPVFPGAFSPQEIYNAWSLGATMVKVFPAKFLGPQYFKEIKGPFKEIELLACGGVTPENLKSYFENGASAVTFGESVFKKEWLKEKNFANITQLIKRYIQEFEDG